MNCKQKKLAKILHDLRLLEITIARLYSRRYK
jgi:hypothetical protein